MSVIYASPDGGPHAFINRTSTPAPYITYPTMRLGPALARARPGDTIRLGRGRYQVPATITVRGTKKAPVTIIGDFGARLDPGLPPAGSKSGHMTPDEDDFAFLTFQDASHVIVKDIAFCNCWPTAFFIRASHHITFENIKGIGSQFVVFARSRRRRGTDLITPTQHIKLDGIQWRQDPEQHMWQGHVRWTDIKTERTHSHLNGALFGSWDIVGDVEVTNCVVEDAFNVVRMDRSRKDKREGETENAPWRYPYDFVRNANVNIHGNRFYRIRDNAVEPEKQAYNWWVYDNWFENCHASLSMHDLSGGWFYIFGNEFWIAEKAGDVDHTGGKLFKFRKPKKKEEKQAKAEGREFLRFEHPIYSFHNSVYLRSPYVQRGETRHWKNYNNAIEYTFEPPHGDPRIGHFSQTRTLSTKNQHKRLFWHETYDHRGDVCNHPDFPDGFNAGWKFDIKEAHQPQRVLKRAGTAEELPLADSDAHWASAVEFELVYADGDKQKLSKSALAGCRQSDGERYRLEYKRIDLDVLNTHLRAQKPYG